MDRVNIDSQRWYWQILHLEIASEKQNFKRDDRLIQHPALKPIIKKLGERHASYNEYFEHCLKEFKRCEYIITKLQEIDTADHTENYVKLLAEVELELFSEFSKIEQQREHVKNTRSNVCAKMAESGSSFQTAAGNNLDQWLEKANYALQKSELPKTRFNTEIKYENGLLFRVISGKGENIYPRLGKIQLTPKLVQKLQTLILSYEADKYISEEFDNRNGKRFVPTLKERQKLEERYKTLQKYWDDVLKAHNDCTSVLKKHKEMEGKAIDSKNSSLLEFVKFETAKELSKIERKIEEVVRIQRHIDKAVRDFVDLFGDPIKYKLYTPSFIQAERRKFERLKTIANKVLKQTELPSPEFNLLIEYDDMIRVRVVNSEGTTVYPDKDGECFTVEESNIGSQADCDIGRAANISLEADIDGTGQKYFDLDERKTELRHYTDRVVHIQTSTMTALNREKNRESSKLFQKLNDVEKFAWDEKLKQGITIDSRCKEIEEIQKETEETLKSYVEMCCDRANSNTVSQSYVQAFHKRLEKVLEKANLALSREVPCDFTMKVEFENDICVRVTANGESNRFPNYPSIDY